MSNKKITDLVELTTPTTDDVLPVVDIATNTTRKVQLGNLPVPSAITTELAAKVPYTGASSNVDLGEFGIGAGYIQADLTPTGALQVGRMQWNATDATMDLRMGGNNVTQQIGQETFLYARNTSGATLLNGKVVKVLGSTGTRTTVALSQASTIANAKATIGVLTEDIANNAEGLITTFGLVRDLNTTAFADGDILYLSSSSAGELTNVAPSIAVRIGICVRSHPSQGVILVGVEYETPLTNPSGVSGAIQFSDGSAFASDASNLFWDNTNKRLGVGTNAPTEKLHVNGNIRVGASAFVYSSAGGGAVTSGMYFDSATPKASVYVGSTERVIFGNSTVATIKGSGSTSATTSLLVQNSAGTQLMKLADDNGVVFGGVASLVNRARFGTYLQLKYDVPAIDIWQGGTGVGLQITNAGALLAEFNDAAGGGAIIRHSLIVGSASFASASARLQVDSTTQGFLPPRMTTTQKNAIASPAAGLVVYDSTTNKLCCYNGSTWNDLF